MSDVWRCKFKHENQSNDKSNEVNIIPHRAEAFHREYLDVTFFVIINIFMSACNLITHFFINCNWLHLQLFCN